MTGLKERKINIDTELWANISKRLSTGTSISHVVNTLLFHFYASLTETDFDLTPHYKEAAERATEELED